MTASIVDNIIEFVLRVDVDNDSHLSEDEVNLLIHKIEGSHGVDVKNEVIREKVYEYGNDLNGIMRLIDYIFYDDPNFEEILNL